QINQLNARHTGLQNNLTIVIAQRNASDNRIVLLQNDINAFRQLNTNQLYCLCHGFLIGNRINQLTQELDDYRLGYILRGRLWRNLSLVWDEQSKSKRALEIIYKVSLPRLEQLQTCRTHGRELKLRLNTCQNDLFLCDLQLDNKHGRMRSSKISRSSGEDPAVFIRDLRQLLPITIQMQGIKTEFALMDCLIEACLEDYAKDESYKKYCNAIANPLVPALTVWDEDWSILGGRPTDLLQIPMQE
ncbi:2213_t:CDS:2, partial [Paraglomus brasilianum]